MFWNRKNNTKNNQNIFKEIIDSLKNAKEKDENLSILFLTESDDSGNSIIMGSTDGIYNILNECCKKDPLFFNVLKKVVASNSSVEDFLPENIKKAISNMEKEGSKSQVVDLPDGSKGLMVDKSDIDSLSEKDIDDIVDNLLDGINKANGNRSKE